MMTECPLMGEDKPKLVVGKMLSLISQFYNTRSLLHNECTRQGYLAGPVVTVNKVLVHSKKSGHWTQRHFPRRSFITGFPRSVTL